jgi:hypothetical protein
MQYIAYAAGELSCGRGILIAVNTQKKTGNKIWVTNTTH